MVQRMEAVGNVLPRQLSTTYKDTEDTPLSSPQSSQQRPFSTPEGQPLVSGLEV